MKYDWYELGMVVVIVSFLGFVVENIWLAVTKGYMNNRNMNLPFLLGYGLAAVFIYFLLGTPSKMILLSKYPVKASRFVKFFFYFLCVMVCVSVGEILLGTVTERLCRIEYWNYTWIPFHITKYTSVPTSMGFAAMITIFMENVLPAIMKIVDAVERISIRSLSAALLLMLTVDFLYCYGQMIRHHDFYEKWKLEFREKLGNRVKEW